MSVIFNETRMKDEGFLLKYTSQNKLHRHMGDLEIIFQTKLQFELLILYMNLSFEFIICDRTKVFVWHEVKRCACACLCVCARVRNSRCVCVCCRSDTALCLSSKEQGKSAVALTITAKSTIEILVSDLESNGTPIIGDPWEVKTKIYLNEGGDMI